MNPAFGDIYLVDFDPSVGHEYKKKRPAIVVQMEGIHADSPCFTVMPMSSKLERRCIHDIFLQKDLKNRLTEDSVIKVHSLHTFDKTRFLYFIGRAGSPTIRSVRGYLRRHFGF